MAYKTNLGGATATFQGMMENGFGIVTVMNAYVCDALDVAEYEKLTAYEIANATYVVGAETELKAAGTGTGGNTAAIKTKALCRLDTLKVANVTQEGPTKTISGGQYSNPLIKFGKSARLEMQDALGNATAIEALCGGVREWKGATIDSDHLVGLHFGEDFCGPKMIIGDTFFIDRTTGQQVKVKVVFYQFLPDSIFNLTQDAEGDATVFDMNGDLLTTDILVADASGSETTKHGIFYSIVDTKESTVTA
jgi:hypothetical protein